MSNGSGNYSFYRHNLRPTNRPSVQPNRLIVRRSSENALNDFESLSILSPTTVPQPGQFAGVPIVSGFVPHPPSLPRSKDGNIHSTPIRFRGKKRSRNDSPRTSGSEDERKSSKNAFHSNISPLSKPPRRFSDGSLGNLSSESEFNRKRNMRGLEPLQGISNKDLVNSFKTYQHSVKSESRNGEVSRTKHSISQPVKVVRDLNGNAEALQKDDNLEGSQEYKEVSEGSVVARGEDGPKSDEEELSSSDESFTNVSESNNTTLSSSSESDLELKAQSEQIVKALSSRRYPDATLPFIPQNDTLGSNTGMYENVNSSSVPQHSQDSSATYESVSGYQNQLLGDSRVNQDLNSRLRGNRCASDSELSGKGGSEASYVSQSSLLPRVPATSVRLRNSNFLQEEMDQYFPERKLCIFVATWNMHEEKDIPRYLDDFLLPENIDFLQDIYVIGLQESTSSRKEWEIRLQETLGPSHVLMHSSSFGVLHMAIFIRRELVWFCSDVRQNSVATRPGHMIKTKGGLAVSFTLFGTSFLFINSHLTSNEGKSKERINDYNTICKSLTLQAVEKPWTDNRSDVTDRFDRVFWLGDFNFRVDMARDKVDELLVRYNKEQNLDAFKELRGKDQLTNFMKKDEVFRGFTEPEIKFAPTYKYDLNSETYDSSSKLRVPSWTDRVLYKSPEENTIKAICYNACSSVISSDHRPVYGVYEVMLKPCKKSTVLTGGQFVRDVYIEANRRRSTITNKTQQDSSVCTIL